MPICAICHETTSPSGETAFIKTKPRELYGVIIQGLAHPKCLKLDREKAEARAKLAIVNKPERVKLMHTTALMLLPEPSREPVLRQEKVEPKPVKGIRRRI